MKAVIYARYSSDRQTEDSIAAQVRDCKEYAQQHDIIIVDTYIDEAVSGRESKTASREAYQKMMKMIGKMVKKDSRGRYFTNTTHKDFDTPDFFKDKALMKDLQKRMKPAKRLHII